jgi:exodeoxyribonuclease X
MSAVVLDCETTGIGDEDKVIEFACSAIIESPDTLIATSIADARFSSDRPITFGAMATHHIIDEDLAGLQPFPGFDVEGIAYIIAHNCDFDWRMMKEPKVLRICTLALARWLWPDLDSHSLGALVYSLSDDKGEARSRLRAAHSAKADVESLVDIVLPAILARLPDVKTWADLWEISEVARIPTIMPYGKHYKMLIKDVPSGYKRWLLDQPDVDPYLRIALKR